MPASPKQEPHAVLAVYRMKPNVSRKAVLDLLRDHARVLLEEKLRTPHPPMILESLGDPRQIMEIFEWVDESAAERAHKNPALQAMWGRFGPLTEDIGLTLSQLHEAKERWPHFLSLKT